MWYGSRPFDVHGFCFFIACGPASLSQTETYAKLLFNPKIEIDGKTNIRIYIAEKLR